MCVSHACDVFICMSFLLQINEYTVIDAELSSQRKGKVSLLAVVQVKCVTMSG